MAKLVHSITLEFFLKAGSSTAPIDAFAPVPVAKVKETQWSWHERREQTKVYELKKEGVLLFEQETVSDHGKLLILQYKFSKQRDTKVFIERLRAELPAEERAALVNGIGDVLDEDGRLCLKLGAEAASLGLLTLSKSGTSVMARLNLAAFPKTRERCVEIAEKILSDG